jgi:hypothetical protein
MCQQTKIAGLSLLAESGKGIVYFMRSQAWKVLRRIVLKTDGEIEILKAKQLKGHQLATF